MSYEGTGNIGDVLTIVAPNDSQFLPPSAGPGVVSGSGAATQVAFWDSSSSITGDYSLWYNDTNRRLGIGTSTPSYNLDVWNITGTTVDPAVYFSFGGLDDMTSGGTFTGTSGLSYDVLIDSTGTPDTFTWTDGTTTVTNVPITGAAQNLSYGVQVTFGATTGHTIADEWGFDTHATLGVGVINVSGTNGQYNITGSFFAGRSGSTYMVGSGGINSGWTDVTIFGSGAGGNYNSDQGTFVGAQAGYDAVNATASTFVGKSAGETATNAANSVFIGQATGANAASAARSVFVGDLAGNFATNASESLFIGQSAGNAATNAADSVFIGQGAGGGAVDASFSTFIGYSAGINATNASRSIFIGNGAGGTDSVDNVGGFSIIYTGLSGGVFAPGDSVTATSGGSGTVVTVGSTFVTVSGGTGTFNNGDTLDNGAGVTATISSATNTTSILIGDTTSTGAFTASVAIGAGAVNTAANQFLVQSITSPFTGVIIDTTGRTFIGDLSAAGNGTFETIDDTDGGFTQQSILYGDTQVTTYHLKVSLTASDIQNANSTPIDIGLPASGAGFYYRIIAFNNNLTFGTVAFTSTILGIGISGLGAIIGTQAQNGAVSGTGNVFVTGVLYSGLIVENDTIEILADSDSLVGDSTIDCYITVEKVKL